MTGRKDRGIIKLIQNCIDPGPLPAVPGAATKAEPQKAGTGPEAGKRQEDVMRALQPIRQRPPLIRCCLSLATLCLPAMILSPCAQARKQQVASNTVKPAATRRTARQSSFVISRLTGLRLPRSPVLQGMVDPGGPGQEYWVDDVLHVLGYHISRALKVQRPEFYAWPEESESASSIKSSVIGRLKKAGYSYLKTSFVAPTVAPNGYLQYFDVTYREGFRATRGTQVIQGLWWKPTQGIDAELTLWWGERVPSTHQQRLNDALINAVIKSQVARVHELLAQGASANAVDYNTARPLIYAAAGGSAPVVRLLLEKGADPRYRDASGASPLMEAIKNRHSAIARLLIESEADVNVRDAHGNTPLLAAAEAGDSQSASLLVAGNADVNACNDEHRTALMQAAYIPSLGGFPPRQAPEIVRLLISHGANLDVRDKYGDSALTAAAYEDRQGVVALLVAGGANVNLRNSRGETPLIAAATQAYTDLFHPHGDSAAWQRCRCECARCRRQNGARLCHGSGRRTSYT